MEAHPVTKILLEYLHNVIYDPQANQKIQLLIIFPKIFMISEKGFSILPNLLWKQEHWQTICLKAFLQVNCHREKMKLLPL